ncbi:hypothetical protein LTR17_018872 [Elasticomyces elasticus]|nr:hypothetical protein LTR17_018872 [Elasticomyces elasticus]
MSIAKARAAEAQTAKAQASGSSDRNENTRYQAPYQRNDGAYEDHYIVAFKQNHTLAKHFAFLGKELEIEGSIDDGYYAKLDRELFETVRRDPSVDWIEDDTFGASFETYDPPDGYNPSNDVVTSDKERATSKRNPIL